MSCVRQAACKDVYEYAYKQSKDADSDWDDSVWGPVLAYIAQLPRQLQSGLYKGETAAAATDGTPRGPKRGGSGGDAQSGTRAGKAKMRMSEDPAVQEALDTPGGARVMKALEAERVQTAALREQLYGPGGGRGGGKNGGGGRGGGKNGGGKKGGGKHGGGKYLLCLRTVRREAPT